MKRPKRPTAEVHLIHVTEVITWQDRLFSSILKLTDTGGKEEEEEGGEGKEEEEKRCMCKILCRCVFCPDLDPAGIGFYLQ